MKKNMILVGLSSDFSLTKESVAEICTILQKEVVLRGNGINVNLFSTKDSDSEILAEITKHVLHLNHKVEPFIFPKEENVVVERTFYSQEWTEIVGEKAKGVDTVVVFFKDKISYTRQKIKFQIQTVVYSFV